MHIFARELRICIAAVVMLLIATLDSYLAMAAAVVFCLIILLYDLFRIFAEGFRGRYFLLSSLMCGIWISLGFMTSFIQIDHAKGFLLETLFPQSRVNISSTYYSLANSYLMFFIASASVVSRLAPIGKAEFKFQNIILRQLIASSRIDRNTVLFFLCIFGLWLSGSNLFVIRGLSQDFQSDLGILPWWYPFISTLLSLFPVLIVTCINKDFKLLSFSGFLVATGIIFAFYFASLQGRATLFRMFVFLPFIWLILHKRLFKLTPKRLLFALFLIIVLCFLAPIFSTLFSFINYARIFGGESINPLRLLELFSEFLSSTSVLTDADARSAENLAFRPLVLWPLAASIAMAINGLNSGYLYFQDVLSSFLNSLPRFVYSFKAELLLQEDLLYSYFPFSSVDTADSPYLYSFASFGILGIIIYPLLIGLLYWSFLFIASNTLKLLTGMPAFFSCALAFSTVAGFAIASYGEMATSDLIRQFLVPTSFIIAIAIASAPFRRLARA